MVAWLKVYQERWVVRLAEAKSKKDTKAVCEEIVADDTGDTDELTQYLAKIVLANLGI